MVPKPDPVWRRNARREGKHECGEATRWSPISLHSTPKSSGHEGEPAIFSCRNPCPRSLSPANWIILGALQGEFLPFGALPPAPLLLGVHASPPHLSNLPCQLLVV